MEWWGEVYSCKFLGRPELTTFGTELGRLTSPFTLISSTIWSLIEHPDHRPESGTHVITGTVHRAYFGRYKGFEVLSCQNPCTYDTSINFNITSTPSQSWRSQISQKPSTIFLLPPLNMNALTPKPSSDSEDDSEDDTDSDVDMAALSTDMDMDVEMIQDQLAESQVTSSESQPAVGFEHLFSSIDK